MKFYATIDYKFCIKHGLNLAEAHLFDWMYSLPSWADKVNIKGQDYFYASRIKAIEELPMITEKEDTMYRHYKSLVSKGLILVKKVETKDYISLTDKAKTWGRGRGGKSDDSEKNPGEVGKKSGGSRKKIRTIPYSDNNTINNNTNNNDSAPCADYPLCMDVYWKFFQERTGDKPSITGKDGSALKRIINNLKKNHPEHAPAVLLGRIFAEWGKLSAFLQNQVSLCQIDHYYNNIVDSLKNAKAKTMQQGSKVDAILNANKQAHEHTSSGTD